MQLITTTQDLRAAIGVPRGTTFVPTMGALHEGHASLVRQASGHARAHKLRHSVVSIFVNPTQFNDATDLDRYPRTLDADLALCERAGATIVFVPEVNEVYPNVPQNGAAVQALILPEVAYLPKLEDAHRPGHFAGVCQVVARLFELVQPAASFFGEKDWQQLQVIRTMTKLLDLPVEIIAGITIREADGLAMSSRNRFLSSEERANALAISRALRKASTHDSFLSAEEAMREVLLSAGAAIDYAVIRDAETLMRFIPGRAGRAIITARFGSIRLLDNTAWGA